MRALPLLLLPAVSRNANGRILRGQLRSAGGRFGWHRDGAPPHSAGRHRNQWSTPSNR